MKKFLILLLALIICFFLYRYFLNRDYIVLNKTSFSDIDEIDTIEAFPEKGLYIVGLVRRGFLGRFSYDLGISKADPKHPTEFVNYEFENNNKSFRVSKDYIAFIKTIGFTNWGWFYVKNGKVMESLPLINKIEDSLRKNTKGFIFSSNGYISLNANGKRIRTYNYGNIILKDSTIDFDLLKLALYKLSDTNVVRISNNADDLFHQKEGVFFIPSPGYGVIKKIGKNFILNYIDSSFNVQRLQEKITLESN